MDRTGRETRTVVLGHLQRGGDPRTQDRILGIRFGVGAIQLIREKKFGHMVSYLNYEIGDVTIKEAIGQIKYVPPDSQMVKTAQAVGNQLRRLEIRAEKTWGWPREERSARQPIRCFSKSPSSGSILVAGPYLRSLKAYSSICVPGSRFTRIE